MNLHDDRAPGARDDSGSESDEVTRLLEAMGRTPVTLPPAVRERVMMRVRAAARSPWRRGWTWATTPVVRLTPATVGLALAAAAAAALLLVRPRAAPEAAVPVSAAVADRVATRFVLIAPTATSVAVTGDFLNWDPKGVQLKPVGSTGTWAAEMALAPGVHHYVFIIDGTEWSPDPNAPSQVDDGFGQKNSVLVVPARAAS